jgi:transcription antitermination factor NusG
MKANVNKYAWVIAYIDAAHIEKVDKELKKYPEYEDISAYIPTIKLLRKSFKGKNEFEDVPLLFNYGFFRIPRKFALYKNFLENLQRDISCIYAWVKDPAKVIQSAPKIRLDGETVFGDKFIPVATATAEEVANIVKNSDNYSTHDSKDIEKLKPGDIIILHGYPFEGVEAKVVDINSKKQEIKVEIMIFDQRKEAKVSFDNVFFTVYHNKGFDDSLVFAGAIDAMTEGRKVDKQQQQKFQDESNT